MKTIKTIISSDLMIGYGLLAISLSFLIFACSAMGFRIGQDNNFGIFMATFAITAIYTISVFFTAFAKHKWKISKSKIEYTVILAVLWFISAFSLNLEMNLFDQSVPWLCFFIISSALSLILALFKNALPSFLRNVTFFFLGTGLVLFLYYALYLIPFYVLSIPAAIALGISIHTYIPLILFILTLVLFNRALKDHGKIKYFFYSGIAFPILVCMSFIFYSKSINNQINRIVNQNTLSEGKLPSWAVIAQSIPRNSLTERLMKEDLVYKTINLNSDWWWGNFSGRSFDEPLQHDPMMVIARLFTEKTNLDQSDRIKILESMYDSRHKAQERLWSGDQLQTANIITNIRLFPEYRMAYTEKILSISNNDKKRWRNAQEAIYTFHLPEGAVVSSLSLWINGREEKANLTTKAKADSAYKQIVGVEQHDPSVVHWQEGNTVSVRIFPCTIEENRKFKIGISSPLKKQGDTLSYSNIYFDGPEARNAIETLQLTYSTKPNNLNLNSDYEEIKPGIYQLTRNYKSDWEIAFKDGPLSPATFSFDQQSYKVRNYVPDYADFNASVIYLDLNQSWTKKEFDEVWSKIYQKKVLVFDDQIILMNNDNKNEVFKKMSKLNFSLFPIYKINHPEGALLISKSSEMSPNLGDLKESPFGEKLTAYLQQSPKIRLYNLGAQLSPYLKALKELRVFNSDSGTPSKLSSLLEKEKFIREQENENKVVVGAARMVIETAKGDTTGTAPDHLMRLFAYNDILKKVSSNYFKADFIQPDVIAEAESANIVTPVSSLIVLETKKDYERFDIEESKNSLKNASMKSSGAVPEPHEWALIILAAGTVLYLTYKPKYSKKTI